MFHLIINPSSERVWRIELEDKTGKRFDPVFIRAFTFQDAIHEWWQGEAENFPSDVNIELGNTLGGVLTFYIEDDCLSVQDVTSDFNSDSISCLELVERRKQERADRKARKVT